MDPRKRILLKVMIAPEDREETADSVERLMGNKPEARFQFHPGTRSLRARQDIIDV